MLIGLYSQWPDTPKDCPIATREKRFRPPGTGTRQGALGSCMGIQGPEMRLDRLNPKGYTFTYTQERLKMILSFKNRRTRQLWEGKVLRLDTALQRKAQLKLRYIQLAHHVSDLRTPPGNRLEKLGGNRKGQHSIRVNQQYRICFRWTSNGAEDVEFVDYH